MLTIKYIIKLFVLLKLIVVWYCILFTLSLTMFGGTLVIAHKTFKFPETIITIKFKDTYVNN